ncbi:MAG: pyridoxal phosphate-dependent aminotransferase [Candidatus Sericytochromatia bacterium]
MINKDIPGFREVPKTGVIYVMQKASELGFTYDNNEWSNLGQGSPETSEINLAPDRIYNLSIDANHQEYSPVAGMKELREKVAEFYNKIYRKDKSSKYTYQNVCIAGGGRQALTRIASALDDINVGHFIPDYTAYEELLSVFKGFNTIPILLNSQKKYQLSPEDLKNQIAGLGLSAVLISNPCNPTGQVIRGENLKEWVNTSNKYSCTLIFDEFYSHYIYNRPENEKFKMVSASEFVDDVNIDPVIIVDGLTKNWRYPGWRISWILGPKTIIDAVSSAGSFLDGGANNPFQKQAISLLEPEFAIQETIAIQKHFKMKRDYMLERLTKMGIVIEAVPEGTFYFWANLSKLPEPLNNGMSFFQEGLKYKFITVPGIFFDVNPGKRRGGINAHYQNYCRISFGPELNKLKTGLDSMEIMINSFK